MVALLLGYGTGGFVAGGVLFLFKDRWKHLLVLYKEGSPYLYEASTSLFPRLILAPDQTVFIYCHFLYGVFRRVVLWLVLQFGSRVPPACLYYSLDR